MNVHLHIERLVVEGFDVPRAALGAAVERELARLVAAGGIAPELAGGVALPSVRVPQVTVPPSPKPAQLGGAVAAAVYRGVGR